MNFDPNDFQDQAALAAMLQRQKMIDLQNQLQSIPANRKLQSIPAHRKCPWCGGLLPGIYPKCTHCASDISWLGNKPFQPGSDNEERARARLQREYAEAQQIKISQVKIEDRQIVACATCQDRRERRHLYNDGLCAHCHYTKKVQIKSDGCLGIFVLIVLPAILILLMNTFNQ